MGYEFTKDWFSYNIPFFERHLPHLVGQPCRVLEIGTHEGRSATWLLDNVLTHPDATLTCVDFVQDAALAGNLVASGSAHKVDLRVGYSRDVLSGIPFESFDFIYVDGCHWACDVLEDAVLSFRRAKVGGIIAFDDYLWDDPDGHGKGVPKTAIDAFLACYSHKLEVIETSWQIWVRSLGG